MWFIQLIDSDVAKQNTQRFGGVEIHDISFLWLCPAHFKPVTRSQDQMTAIWHEKAKTVQALTCRCVDVGPHYS